MLRIGRVLIAIVMLAGCAVEGGVTLVPAVGSCDRNGNQEQRIACDR
jgi:hypothetical protein